MLFISRIELPRDEDAAAFGAFMRDEYLPAVRRGPTRVGMVEGLELLQRAGSETSHTFLWLVRWSGLDPGPTFAGFVDDETVRRKFERFGARIQPHVGWREIARTSEPVTS